MKLVFVNIMQELQHWALRFSAELGRMECRATARTLRVGLRGRGLGFAGLLLSARSRGARQARALMRQLDQAMAVDGGRIPCEVTGGSVRPALP